MGTKSDVVVKVVFMFFVTLLSFSVGTFVGKKYSDNQYQLASLEPHSKKESTHETAAAHSEGHTAPAESHSAETNNSAMSDADIAKLAEEFMTEESSEVLPVPSPAEVANKEGATKATASVAGSASTHTETERKPTSVPKATLDANKPTSLPHLVGEIKSGQFTVQVGSYDNEKDAQNFALTLKTKGYSAYYIPADVKGKTYYRVSVGQFTTRKEAEDYRNTMLEKSVVSAALVQKIL